MHTGSAGIDLIKTNEGCRLDAYRDIVGVLTIGYGDTKNVQEGMSITQQEADERLHQRLVEEFEPGVTQAISGAVTTQPQFDAMVNLAWNIGVRAFSGSSVARHHRQQNNAAAADAFALWNKAGGQVIQALVRRRAQEKELYLSSAHVATPSQPINDEIVSSAVEVLQHLLTIAGTYQGVPDGIWGPLSQRAIEEFQQRI